MKKIKKDNKGSDEDESPRYLKSALVAIKVGLVLVGIKLGLVFIGVKLELAN